MDFECGIHFIDEEKKVPYRTPSYEEWQKHVAELEHEHKGFVDCKDCGDKNIPVKVTMKKAHYVSAPAYCGDCLKRLKEQISQLEGNPNE